MLRIPRKYHLGFIIAEFSTQGAEGYGDTEDDHLIKRLIVSARFSDGISAEYGFDLVVSGQVEVCDTSLENGGHYEPPVELYRIPFPFEPKLRNSILKIIKNQPKFYRI